MQQTPTLMAGAARIDITPPVGVWLDGIPRAQPSDSIHDPLHARALVVSGTAPSGASATICLVSCDLIGFTSAYAGQVRRDVGSALGIDRQAILLACAHNHSGPATIGAFSPPETAYLAELRGKLVAVCREAAARMQPALLGSGQGREGTVSQYRRLWTRDGKIVMNWEPYPDDQIVGPAEQGDPEVGVVQIKAPSGEGIAVVFNYACHPNSLTGDDYTITADFPGFAAGLIESELGGAALFTNGAQGSVDVEGFVDRDLHGVERRGRALGEEVLRVCHQIEARPDAVVAAASETFLLPYRDPGPELLAWAREVLANATGEIETLRDGISDEIKAQSIQEQAAREEPGVDFEMVGLRLGDSVLVGIPGELFTEIGRRVKGLSRGLRIYPVSLGNGCHGYLPTAKAVAEGGYGTDIGSGAPFVENSDDLIVRGIENLCRRLQ